MMFVDNLEDMFEDLGLFKHSLTTCNDEVLNSFIKCLAYVFSLKLYHVMKSMIPSTHLFLFLFVYIYSIQ